MLEFLQQIYDWFSIIGPHKYLQALAIAASFLLLGKIVEWFFAAIAGRIASRSKTQLDNRVVDLLHKPIFLSFLLIGLTLATRRVELPASPEYLTLGLLRTVGIIVWFNVFLHLIGLVVTTMSERRDSKLVKTGMLQLLQNVGKVVLVALAAYFVFLAWDINVTAWVASAGIVGLALSFAARDTLSNLFAGVSIVMDAPYKTGDFITLDSGERGVVTMVGLRSTRILTRDDIEITIPNGVIGNAKIVNEAGGPSQKHRIRVAIGVAYGSDVDKVIATLESVAAENQDVCKYPEPRVRLRNFGDFSLNFELLCWIEHPVDRGRLQHELNCALYKAFAANEIKIPFPTRELRFEKMPPGLPEN